MGFHKTREGDIKHTVQYSSHLPASTANFAYCTPKWGGGILRVVKKHLLFSSKRTLEMCSPGDEFSLQQIYSFDYRAAFFKKEKSRIFFF